MDNGTNSLFRKALNEEFNRRVRKNPNYSIRSFAQYLEVESSSLAQILSGKRKLTDKMCDRLGSRLGYGPVKLKALKRNVSTVHGSLFRDFQKLEEDTFHAISDWPYFAVLELTHCDGFVPQPLWISQVLDLPLAETQEIIERLKRLGYLEVRGDEWIDRLGDTLNLGNEQKAQAFTEHQRQILGKAIRALDEVPYEQRTQTSITVAVSKERAIEAKQLILNFVEELNEFLKSGPTTDEVYTLSVSLYPLSKITGELS